MLGKSPPEFEETRQVTLDEPQELNLGLEEEPWNTFISGNMSSK